MFLKSKDKQTVRSMAASEWNRVNRESMNLSNQERVNLARRRTEERIRRRFSRSRTGYSSIISAIFISLLVRFATKLIERWLEKKLFSVGESGDE